MTTPLRIGPSGPPTTIPSGPGDHKVLASPSDTTPGYLLPVKLVGGANITLVLVNPGGDESVRIDATGGAVAGPPNALAYYDALGAISGDALLTAIPLDQFGRPQIRDLRQGLGVNPPGAVFRQGAWQADGDAQNIQGEGIVVYGPAPNGLQDVANGTIGRVKYDRFQIRMIIGGVDIGSAWRVDPTHEFFTDDAGVMTAEIVRASGQGRFVTVQVGALAGPGLSTIDTQATVARPFHLPDISGTAVVVQDVTGKVYLGLGVTGDVISSNAGVQYSTLTANRAQLRVNQFGAHGAGPGATGFKSRGLVIGQPPGTPAAFVGCIGGDILYRITAIGVAPNNSDIPLAALLSFQVPAGFVPPAFPNNNYLPTELEIELVESGINTHRPVFKISPAGETQTLRGVRAGGLATLPASLGTGALWSSGAGDPNVLLIPGTIGDLFSNTAGGAGTTFWVKEAGAPNSTGGWVPTRIPTLHADNGASAFPLPAFPAVTTVATTPVVAIAAGQRILPTSRVLAEITSGGGTMATGVFANPIVPPGAPIIIDYTDTTVVGSPKQTLSSAGAEVTLPPGTYTFSLLVTSTALVTGSVPATGVGYPIPPAVLTVMVLSP